ncbi:aminotransferase class I/II-fold pyridoxal phosphate-dependent enzyme [Desulfoluna spongiiphila]|uniref:L-threonine aldolase n=1 Tax=Desulfoluna spongiiphila TaxID=419481 RepID=A0A1G5D057_9BACT|nr:aminotransferase class I/II-fold pyridoxal phosphate-dependent enzyme [Desulfoluna spongiiphila]SCY07891.1 L-threonine aldolase [Desulfoluna spongiiphila]
MQDEMISLASDNYAGAHPEIVSAVGAAAVGTAGAYGADPWTAVAEERFKKIFGEETSAFLVMTGTAANILSIDAVTRPFEAVLISDCAHLHMDECGAPERFTGSKFIVVPSVQGKLTVEGLRPWVEREPDYHRVRPRVVSITQTTEFGTVYSVDEIKAITGYAHEHGLLVHMDGSRISNAAASLGLDFPAFTKDAGVDFLSFGGTKNGMMFGEAVVFFTRDFDEAFQYTRMQGMQLVSKMRFVGAQFEAFLKDGLWKRNADHANTMARKIAEALDGAPGVTLTQPVDANAVFALLPPEMIEALQKRFHFYVWNNQTNEVRLMASFATTENEIQAFAEAVKALVNLESFMTDSLKTTISTYDDCADAYADKFMDYPAYREMMIRFRDTYVKKGAAVLDIGCGPGNNAALLSEKKVALTGIDLSAEMVNRARAHVPSGDFRVGDIRDLSGLGTFDVVIASFCIVHITPEEARGVIKEAASLLVPGGALYLSFMVGKKDGYETTSFSGGGEIHFTYHDPEAVKGWLAENQLSVVETHLSDYPEGDGSITTDTFLFIRK